MSLEGNGWRRRLTRPTLRGEPLRADRNKLPIRAKLGGNPPGRLYRRGGTGPGMLRTIHHSGGVRFV